MPENGEKVEKKVKSEKIVKLLQMSWSGWGGKWYFELNFDKLFPKSKRKKCPFYFRSLFVEWWSTKWGRFKLKHQPFLLCSRSPVILYLYILNGFRFDAIL